MASLLKLPFTRPLTCRIIGVPLSTQGRMIPDVENLSRDCVTARTHRKTVAPAV
jgi:hypothetical protein